MWIKDLAQIRECNGMLVWLPHDSTGTAAELMYGLEWQKRIRYQDKDLEDFTERRAYLIYIISAKKHPLFAYALQFGNKQFESVSDFDKRNEMRW